MNVYMFVYTFFLLFVYIHNCIYLCIYIDSGLIIGSMSILLYIHGGVK